MPDFYPLARQLLWRVQPETAHKIALWTLRAGLGFLASGERMGTVDHPALAQSLWGLNFRNPVGIAAGFDKDALAFDALLRFGFGAVEVGTVTPRQQSGNLKPRLFRLDQDKAIINRMGFPSAGLDTVLKRIARHKRSNGILGINLGKNLSSKDAAADYIEGIRLTAGLADYLVINISSPNTPGLRELQRREPLRLLMKELIDTRDRVSSNTPLLIKIAPDLSNQESYEVADVALDLGIDGIVISNTTVERPTSLKSPEAEEQGGLSGPQLFETSTVLLSEIYRLTSGRIPLIGVGGISSAEDAYTKIRAGASLVQVHSSLIFNGLSLVAKIKAGILRLLSKDGFSRITDAIGVDHIDSISNGFRRQGVAVAPHFSNTGSGLEYI
ncbi:MAG TPA: quinone-dependent dihydroorotate dehydrogenase, partial [Acidothermaceae bacterium]|nr:quinone-dependent dihydroorotate dehydrogenase [Acidothermaceae bacterium]